MADKAISELISAEQIMPTDMFVLEQNGTAKKLTGQILLNWLTAAADGHGGIQSYELLKTEGLVKTYRFTLADQTSIDIEVVDGRGVDSVKPTSTNGLVVTYTITYNDGKTDTFTVTNGAKGDKGDRADIWVKYASQKPTTSSHSFGDVSDVWIGIATGHNMDEAPTDWQQYTWFQWKGEKGDPGDPAALVSSQVTYQAGSSGTIIPSGSWSSSIPAVPSGSYLWTRQVLQFNSGGPITSYSVARFGIDGSGAVSSVAGVSPDPNGNVPLSASDVGALSDKGGTMQGAINMNGQPIKGLNAPTEDSQAATKGYVDNNKVDKSKVVNEFNVTKEGLVADARALKVLNDSKLSMELLWENASLSSTFESQVISIDLTEYSFVKIEFIHSIDKSYYGSIDVPVGHSCLLSMGQADDSSSIYVRHGVIATNSITFGNAIVKNQYVNTAMVPTKIFGIKGVTV